jgi:glucan biosynthesis protein C
MNTPTTTSRLYFIDWIRVIAFGLLIFFHCAMPFVPHGWEVKNKETSDGLYTVVVWFHQWRLPLLFFISGAGIYFSLQKRTIIKFYLERLRRLFIPLLFAMFFTIPVQVYFEFLQRGRIKPGYLDFYPSVWKLVPYPEGSLTWSHMWFIVYLLAFLIVLIPFFAVTKVKLIESQIQKLRTIIAKPWVLILLFTPIYLIYKGFYIEFPEQGSLFGDSFVFNSSLIYLVLGFLLAGADSFWTNTAKYRYFWLTGSAFCAIILIFNYYTPVDLPKTNNTYAQLYFILDAVHIWCIILTITGFAKKYLSRDSITLQYLNKAILPFFIIHQTVIVALGFYLVQSGFSIGLKYISLSIMSGLIIYLLYEFLIKRTRITRFLFGMQ